ncbi:MAG TPA: hypothetical protein VF748_15475 [Candidatus Acidoferrum sp.]
MASTPKNPLDQSDRAGPSNRTLQPSIPPYDGGQFARDSMTPEEISIMRDAYWNEIPTDRPYHMDTTPQSGSPGDYTADLQGGRNRVNYGGRQYDTIVRSPSASQYGVGVTDRGQSPSREVVSVNPNSADRGKES